MVSALVVVVGVVVAGLLWHVLCGLWALEERFLAWTVAAQRQALKPVEPAARVIASVPPEREPKPAKPVREPKAVTPPVVAVQRGTEQEFSLRLRADGRPPRFCAALEGIGVLRFTNQRDERGRYVYELKHGGH